MKDRKPVVSLEALKKARQSVQQKISAAAAVVTGDMVEVHPEVVSKKPKG